MIIKEDPFMSLGREETLDGLMESLVLGLSLEQVNPFEKFSASLTSGKHALL